MLPRCSGVIALGLVSLVGCDGKTFPVANFPIRRATAPPPPTARAYDEQAAAESPQQPAEDAAANTAPNPNTAEQAPRAEIPAELVQSLQALGARISPRPDGHCIDIRRKEGVTDREIDLIVKCPQLVDLTLETLPITDAGLKPLGTLPQLRRLILNECPVTSEGLKTLAESPVAKTLTCLGLRRTQIAAGDTSWLKKFERLERLDVSQTNLTDANLADLEALPLTYLNVAETPITEAGLAPLRKKHPKLMVNR